MNKKTVKAWIYAIVISVVYSIGISFFITLLWKIFYNEGVVRVSFFTAGFIYYIVYERYILSLFKELDK